MVSSMIDHRPVWYYMRDGSILSWEEDPPCAEIKYWCREGDVRWTPAGSGPIPRLPRRKRRKRVDSSDGPMLSESEEV